VAVGVEVVDRDAVDARPVADQGRTVREDGARSDHQREADLVIDADVARLHRRTVLQVNAIQCEDDVVIQRV